MATSNPLESGSPGRWASLERYKIYAFALVLLLIGVLLIFLAGPQLEDHSERWSSAASELGIASVIAGALMAGVERYLKEQLFSEIDQKFSNSLVKFATTANDLQFFGRMPVPLRQRIRDQVLSAHVIQRDVAYTYELSPIEIDDARGFRASVSARSRYVNLSTSDQRFDVKEALPAFPFEERRGDYGFQKVTGSLVAGNGTFPAELVPQAIQNHISTKAGSTLFTREAVLESNAELVVTFEAIAYLDRDDVISLEAFLPTIDMTCTTSGPGLRFSGQAGDALGDIWDVDVGDHGERRWRLSGAILPGQGFDLWFEEDEDTPS